jgi:hypothetical protein
MSKQLFELMRAEEMAVLYDSTFTKKEASATGVSLTKSVLESGTVDKMQFFANIARLKEVISKAEEECRKSIDITEKTSVLGVIFNPTNGGNTINYSEDEIWCELKRCLDERTEQLKLAQKQDTFDAYGNQVPKVSTTPKKSSIKVTF